MSADGVVAYAEEIGRREHARAMREVRKAGGLSPAELERLGRVFEAAALSLSRSLVERLAAALRDGRLEPGLAGRITSATTGRGSGRTGVSPGSLEA